MNPSEWKLRRTLRNEAFGRIRKSHPDWTIRECRSLAKQMGDLAMKHTKGKHASHTGATAT
jgi:hypothetical protein